LSFLERREDVTQALRKTGLVAGTPVGLVYAGNVAPVELVNLNNLADRTIRIEVEGETLETMDYDRALREAYPGAVILHQAETYLVRKLDLEAGVAHCAREDVDYYTEPLIREDVRILRSFEEREIGALRLGLGEVRVTQEVRAFPQAAGRGHPGSGGALPSASGVRHRRRVVRGAKGTSGDIRASLAGALHGAEHALVAMAPLYAMADRWDFGGVSTPFHPDLAGPAILVHESFAGGVGLVRKLFAVAGEWVKAAADLVGTCPCQDGCPSCVLSPAAGTKTNPWIKKEQRCSSPPWPKP
jgi:DEAD/DEAH box helicase domain-containing protein